MTSTGTIPVFDGHNDVLLRIYRGNEGKGPKHDLFTRNDGGHLDLPRAHEGGFGGGFFAVFVPPPVEPPEPDRISADYPLPPPIDRDYAQRMAMSGTALLVRAEDEADCQLKVVRTADELAACVQSGVMAAILLFEGAEAIVAGLDALELFDRAGVRSVGPV